MKKYIYRLGHYPLVALLLLIKPQSHGACVIVVRGRDVLLVRHTYGNRQKWCVPGGSKKAGEELKTTALRELKEELGLSLDVVLLGTITASELHLTTIDTYYVAEYGNQKIDSDKNEIEEYKWWPATALPDKLSTSAIEGLKMYLNK